MSRMRMLKERSGSMPWDDTPTNVIDMSTRKRFYDRERLESEPISEHFADAISRWIQPTEDFGGGANISISGSEWRSLFALMADGESRRAENRTKVDLAMSEAERFLDLKDNWDGEESRGYEEATLERTGRLLRNLLCRHRFDGSQIRVKEVYIDAGPRGSFEAEIITHNKRLLINVPSSLDLPPAFYGHESERRFPIKGELNMDRSNKWLASWFTE